MKWYIGQEIVCVKSHSKGVVKIGQIFIIRGLMQGCCGVKIDVGIIPPCGTMFCRHCNYHYTTNGKHWFTERLFSPLEYDQQAIDELLKIEEPQNI